MSIAFATQAIAEPFKRDPSGKHSALIGRMMVADLQQGDGTGGYFQITAGLTATRQIFGQYALIKMETISCYCSSLVVANAAMIILRTYEFVGAAYMDLRYALDMPVGVRAVSPNNLGDCYFRPTEAAMGGNAGTVEVLFTTNTAAQWYGFYVYFNVFDERYL